MIMCTIYKAVFIPESCSDDDFSAAGEQQTVVVPLEVIALLVDTLQHKASPR